MSEYTYEEFETLRATWPTWEPESYVPLAIAREIAPVEKQLRETYENFAIVGAVMREGAVRNELCDEYEHSLEILTEKMTDPQANLRLIEKAKRARKHTFRRTLVIEQTIEHRNRNDARYLADDKFWEFESQLNNSEGITYEMTTEYVAPED